MAVNGIRVSALPEMIASDLTNDDYLIVNDANTNTRRINYEEFLKSVNVDISEDVLDVVRSVNGMTKEVNLTNVDVNAPSTSEFITLRDRVDVNDQLTASTAQSVAGLTVSLLQTDNNVEANTASIASNTTEIQTNATDIGTNANNISTNASGIATNVTNIATMAQS